MPDPRLPGPGAGPAAGPGFSIIPGPARLPGPGAGLPATGLVVSDLARFQKML